MNILSSGIFESMTIIDGDETFSFPDWASSLAWLGAWCRLNQQPGKRLIVFAVLPTRELAAAFAGLGCLIAGAGAFEETLSWPTFKNMPAGRCVFWIHNNTGMRYSGEITGFEEYGGTEFIVVKITNASKNKKSYVGSSIKINQRYFEDYRFTEEKPPSAPKSMSLDTVSSLLKALIGNISPKWIWSDGAEGLLVTSVTKFVSAIENLSLSISGKQPITLSAILCMARNKGHDHAKLRLDHPKGSLDGNFPVAILDGSKAFEMHEHLASIPNLLIILDRSEYQERIHDTALLLGGISQDISPEFMQTIPEKFAPGIELSAYLIDGQ